MKVLPTSIPHTAGKVATDGPHPTMIPAWVNGRLCPVEKLTVHHKGLRHKAVSVFVMQAGRTLIQRRALVKYHTPGLWANTCCTHPDWDEDPLACAHRRLHQELGISGLDPIHRGQVEYRAAVGGGLTEHELVDIYVAQAPAGLRITPNLAEVADIAWVDFATLQGRIADEPDAFTPWLKIYLADHASKIFGG